MASARGSSARAKTAGLRGQPRHVDRWNGKLSDLYLLVITDAKGLLYKSLIYFRKLSPKSNLCNTQSRQGHLTRSKVLSASNEITKQSIFFVWQRLLMFRSLLVLWLEFWKSASSLMMGAFSSLLWASEIVRRATFSRKDSLFSEALSGWSAVYSWI